MTRKTTLPELKTILEQHPAFQNVSKLEQMAATFGVKIVFAPKYHCECNPIEGLWCWMKNYVRTRSDQTFPKMLQLIDESRLSFCQEPIVLKLFRRFWKTLAAYNEGKSYEEVLTFYFSHLCKSEVQSHRKITNTKL